MDKRIIWFALIIFLAVGGIFLYRYLKKPKADALTLNFSIDKPTIVVGDSIYFEDNTEGATSWFWEFGDGTTSKQQKGYNVYYESDQYNIKLTVNGLKTDSSFFVTVNPVDADKDQVISQRIIVSGPRIAYVGVPVTFTDNTPGAQHTDWRNMVTYEKKLDSKTYTTTFTQKGDFTIIATNEKNTKGSNGQGIITGRVIDKIDKVVAQPPPPRPASKPDERENTKLPPPPPPPSPVEGKQYPSNDQLKAWLSIIAAEGGKFTDEYKPVKDGIKDESVPVLIINQGTRIEGKKLYGACSYLRMVSVKVLNVQADWDPTNGFKGIKIIVEEKK